MFIVQFVTFCGWNHYYWSDHWYIRLLCQDLGMELAEDILNASVFILMQTHGTDTLEW